MGCLKFRIILGSGKYSKLPNDSEAGLILNPYRNSLTTSSDG